MRPFHLLLGLGLAAAVAAVAAVAAACGDGRDANAAAGSFTPRRDGRLTVATSSPAAGFWEGRDLDHVEGGFEYELATELTDRFGLDHLRIVQVPFDQLVAGEGTGFDVALDQVSITDERAEVVDLSEPYLTTPVGVVGRSGPDPVDVGDLAAARQLSWAVGEATTEVDVVEDLIRPEEDARVYPTTEAALHAVAAGQVDVAAVDYLRALAEAAADRRLVLAAQITAPQHYAVLLPRGSDNLPAVNAAIRSLAADGTLRRLRDELYDRFDVDQDDVPTIRVTPR